MATTATVMTIGEVAARAGLAPSAIRYYEAEGLLPAPARVGGKRRYGPDALRRLALVRAAQGADFTIREIRTLFAEVGEGAPAGDAWRELARRKLPEVDAAIADLLAVRAVLRDSLRCDCLTLDACESLGLAAVAGDVAPPR